MFDKYKKSHFLRSISTLASGSVIAQLIVLLSAPVITRLYTPSEIGTYTYLLSITFIFMGVINGRYEMSIVTEAKEERVFALIKLSLIIGLIGSILITIGYIVLLLLNDTYIEKRGSIPFIFIVLVSFSIINVLTAYNNRMKEYKIMSIVYIIRTSFQDFGAILAGLFKVGTIGLTLSYLLGQFFGIRKQGKTLIPYIKRIKDVTVSEMAEVSRMHKRQPYFAAPAALASSFSYSSITLFIESLFGFATVGFYSISVRLLGLPLSVISGNVSKVFFESASKEKQNTGQFFSSFRKTFLFQFVLAIPMVTIMMLFAPSIAVFIFGKEWEIAGKYIVILAPMFGIRFIVTTLSPSTVVASKQNFELFTQLTFIFVSIISFIITRSFGMQIESFLTMISIAYSIVYLYFLYVIFTYSKG